MNWVQEAKSIFKVKKPDHFTDYNHCEECAEHDNTLLNNEIDTIGLEELGNPGWDPVCFSNDEGKKYYMPSFVRLSLESINNDFYLGQLLFHLESNGENNSFYKSCTKTQRKYIASFIQYMIETYPKEIDENCNTDEALKVYDLWSKA